MFSLIFSDPSFITQVKPRTCSNCTRLFIAADAKVTFSTLPTGLAKQLWIVWRTTWLSSWQLIMLLGCCSHPATLLMHQNCNDINSYYILGVPVLRFPITSLYNQRLRIPRYHLHAKGCPRLYLHTLKPKPSIGFRARV